MYNGNMYNGRERESTTSNLPGYKSTSLPEIKRGRVTSPVYRKMIQDVHSDQRRQDIISKYNLHAEGSEGEIDLSQMSRRSSEPLDEVATDENYYI